MHSDILLKKWASITLLSIIVPVGLLVTFRLTGVLKEPTTPELITLDTVYWNISRPRPPLGAVTIDQWVQNTYENNVASLGLGVHVCTYLEDSSGWDYMDVFLIRVLTTVNVTDGYVHSVTIKFYDIDDHAALDIDESDDHIELYNLDLTSVIDWDWEFGEDAYFATQAVNKPKRCQLEILTAWLFIDENNIDHVMTVSAETIFFNGFNYQKIITPIRLEVPS